MRQTLLPLVDTPGFFIFSPNIKSHEICPCPTFFFPPDSVAEGKLLMMKEKYFHGKLIYDELMTRRLVYQQLAGLLRYILTGKEL